MTRPALASVAAVAVLAVGCASAATPGTDAPSSMPPVASPRVTAEPAPTPTPRATSTTVTPPAGDFTVDCGPLTVCLQVIAAAEAGLDVEGAPYTRVAVLPFEAHWTPPPVASPTTAPVEPAVEIETFVIAYAVEFSGPTEAQVIPVFQGSEGWTAGLPPAATRVYRFARDAGSWTEPGSFALGSAEYVLDAGCSGDGSSAGGATVRLEHVAEPGSVPAETVRLGCGPTMTSGAFGQSLRLAAGRYRLAVEGLTGTLEVRLTPVTAE